MSVPPSEQELREKHARLVEFMSSQPLWKDNDLVRCALTIAAGAIRRGRHLTEDEKLDNLANYCEREGESDLAEIFRNQSRALRRGRC